jgi:hypothetical protein
VTTNLVPALLTQLAEDRPDVIRLMMRWAKRIIRGRTDTRPFEAGELPLGRIGKAYRFDCGKLHTSGMAAGECVRRQLQTAKNRTRQGSRGQGGGAFPLCGPLCVQGVAIRAALVDRVTWTGAGPGQRFSAGRDDAPEQHAAHVRAARVGLLYPERILDVDPDPTGSHERGT